RLAHCLGASRKLNPSKRWKTALPRASDAGPRAHSRMALACSSGTVLCTRHKLCVCRLISMARCSMVDSASLVWVRSSATGMGIAWGRVSRVSRRRRRRGLIGMVLGGTGGSRERSHRSRARWRVGLPPRKRQLSHVLEAFQQRGAIGVLQALWRAVHELLGVRIEAESAHLQTAEPKVHFECLAQRVLSVIGNAAESAPQEKAVCRAFLLGRVQGLEVDAVDAQVQVQG